MSNAPTAVARLGTWSLQQTHSMDLVQNCSGSDVFDVGPWHHGMSHHHQPGNHRQHVPQDWFWTGTGIDAFLFLRTRRCMRGYPYKSHEDHTQGSNWLSIVTNRSWCNMSSGFAWLCSAVVRQIRSQPLRRNTWISSAGQISSMRLRDIANNRDENFRHYPGRA